MYVDPAARQWRRHHLHESVLQREVKHAVRGARITKRATGSSHPGGTWRPASEAPLAGQSRSLRPANGPRPGARAEDFPKRRASLAR
jgi:hypothetical protein